MKLTSAFKYGLLGAACVVASMSQARADVIVSLGYYDTQPVAGFNTNLPPNPWYGSANTTFLGSSSQATSSDPDESAILLYNNGPTAITLDQGFSVTSGTTYQLWDSLIGAGGLSIGAGDYVILSGTAANPFDGSDIPLTDSLIKIILNGTTYNITDTASILAGFDYGVSSEDETLPWTQVDDIGGTSATPLPAALPLFATGFGAMGLLGWRRKWKAQALAA